MYVQDSKILVEKMVHWFNDECMTGVPGSQLPQVTQFGLQQCPWVGKHHLPQFLIGNEVCFLIQNLFWCKLQGYSGLASTEKAEDVPSFLCSVLSLQSLQARSTVMRVSPEPGFISHRAVFRAPSNVEHSLMMKSNACYVSSPKCIIYAKCNSQYSRGNPVIQ